MKNVIILKVQKSQATSFFIGCTKDKKEAGIKNKNKKTNNLKEKHGKAKFTPILTKAGKNSSLKVDKSHAR